MGCTIKITNVTGPMLMAVNYGAVLQGIAREYENDEDDQVAESFHWVLNNLGKDMRKPVDRRWLADYVASMPNLVFSFREGDDLSVHVSSMWMTIECLCSAHATQPDLNDTHWSVGNTAWVLESMGATNVEAWGTVDPTTLKMSWPDDGELWARQQHIYIMAQVAIELGEQICWG